MKTVTKSLQVLMVLLLLAFAFQSKAQITLYTEGWETAAVGTTPPAGWAVDQLGYGNWTSWVNGGTLPTCSNYEGARMVQFNSWNASTGYQNRLRRTASISTMGYSNITVDFAMYMQTTFSAGDGLFVEWSTNGTTWTQAGVGYYNYGATLGWQVFTQALPAGAANQATLYIAYRFISNYGYNVFTDLTHIKGMQTGNLTGTVRNCYNNAVMANVPVSCGGIGPVLTNASGVYTLNSIPAGAQTITATFAGFTPYTSPVTVIGNTTTTYNFCMAPIPATLAGIITNAASGNPVKGAKIVCNGNTAYSLTDGSYTISIYPTTSGTATVTKAGFEDYTSGTLTFTAGNTTTLNVGLAEALNKPAQPFVAALTPPTTVNLNWGVPKGNYELIYDDGVQELSTVWAQEGNMNAVAFTALNYPATIISGSVNIGKASDYPSGTVPSTLAPFQIQIYDATGAGGTPGAAIGDPIDVQPTTFGWNAFALPATNLTSGNFFLVMIQGGVPPAAARIGVDNTATQLRSYSKFVTGSGPWLPADGNFMMRCVVNGAGGPIDAILGYRVYRLKQTQEIATGNVAPGTWTQISTPTATNTIDNSWQTLEDAPWRWAVQTKYTGNRWSDFTYSNPIGKNWTAAVTVNVTLTCAATPAAGTIITLTNTAPGVDSVYTGTTDATGKVLFPHVWKGSYAVKGTRSGYSVYNSTATIMGDMTIEVALLIDKIPPKNMFVDQFSLLATWNPPTGMNNMLFEEFTTGFGTNAWVNGGYWVLATGTGNPAPSAEFNWLSYVTNYSYSLTSKSFTGMGAADFKLKYDIYLSDYASDGAEQLDVEIQVGAGPWTSLKHYANEGNIDWTTETINIAAYTNSTFKIRFNAHGSDVFNINNWDIDNVKIVATVPDPKPCILAYNVYLNGTLDGVTTDTTYTIPPNHVTYGTYYHACVKAVYGSGYSTESCYDFQSKFLYPPTVLQGEGIECNAYLTWTKPAIASKVHVPAFKGEVENMAPNAGLAPIDRSKMDPAVAEMNTVSYGPKGSTALGFEAVNAEIINFDVDNLAGYTVVSGNPLGDFNSGYASPVGELNWVYASYYGNNNLYKIDRATGAATLVGNMTGHTGGFNGLAIDPTTNFLYGNDATAGTLWRIDPTVPSATLVGAFNGGVSTMIGITCDDDGNLWGHDVGTDRFYSIDKATGAATAIGSLGFNAQYAQCELYDQATGNVLLGGFNGTNLTGEIRAVDVTTGATTILSSLYYAEITAASIPITSSHDPAGLLGYKIYRDGLYLDYVSGKDTTWYYDYNVDPGIHEYEVSAWYDLTPYLYPGQFGESMLEGPIEINIECGRFIPFFEPWDAGSYAYNDWSHTGNWLMNTATGNPAPTADFSWLPAIVDYNQSIETPVLNASQYTCATVWVDFDVKLVDRNNTSKEKLDVELFVNGSWSSKETYVNNGSFDWTTKHVKIATALGKAFKVRFRAHGEDSQDILHWYVDNIHVYAVCTPPTALAVKDVKDNDVYLSWTPPSCKQGPPATWITWDDGTNTDAIGTGGAVEFDIAARWTPAMISGLDGGSVTKVRFWPASSGVATYKIRVWQGADAANLIIDQAVASVTDDDWNEISIASPEPIDVTQELWIGVNVNASSGYPAGVDAGPAIDEFGNMMYYQGAWATLISLNPSLDYNWDIEALIETVKGKTGAPAYLKQTPYYSTGTFTTNPVKGEAKTGTPRTVNAPLASSLLGYDIFRSDDEQVTFNQINTAIVVDTFYVDPDQTYQKHYYYVQSHFAECNSENSNIVMADVITGIDPKVNGTFSIYPNPATEVVNVNSDYSITNIEMLNYVGQTVYNKQNVDTKAAKINVSGLLNGVYFVKVTTTQGIRTVKITVTH